jgi:hypothetical protein
MNTMQVHSINSFTLTRLSFKPNLYKNDIFNKSFLKKFVTKKWPYELYKGSVIQDFWTILSSM